MNNIYEKEKLYDFSEWTTEQPSKENFYLHLHDEYEIFMFLKGEAKYVVEGNYYDLEPNDIIVIKKYQMHRIYHNSCTPYRRFICMIKPAFFQADECQEYEEAFLNLSEKIGNKIDAETVISSGLLDIITRLKKYSESAGRYSPVTLSAMTEMLYLINNIKMNPTKNTISPRVKHIISYINNNFTKNITLDELEKQFYISKYHLCHLFLQSTGLTIHQFITKKRLALAKDLIDSGKSISEAARISGFNTYSSFYRAYVNEHNQAPKK